MATKQLVAVVLCSLFMRINLPQVPEQVGTTTYSSYTLLSLFASGREINNLRKLLGSISRVISCLFLVRIG